MNKLIFIFVLKRMSFVYRQNLRGVEMLLELGELIQEMLNLPLSNPTTNRTNPFLK